MNSIITPKNKKAKFGIVYRIRGNTGEPTLLTLNKENGILYYIPRELIDKIESTKLSDVLKMLHRSCHDNDYNRSMRFYCELQKQ